MDFKMQIDNFKKAMDEAYKNFDAENDDMIDKFYTSVFSVTFTDKTTNTTSTIDFSMGPEVWGLFENLIDTVQDNIDDYE